MKRVPEAVNTTLPTPVKDLIDLKVDLQAGGIVIRRDMALAPFEKSQVKQEISAEIDDLHKTKMALAERRNIAKAGHQTEEISGLNSQILELGIRISRLQRRLKAKALN